MSYIIECYFILPFNFFRCRIMAAGIGLTIIEIATDVQDGTELM